MDLVANFTVKTDDLISCDEAAMFLNRHGPTNDMIAVKVVGSISQWQACGAKVFVSGHVAPPAWFAKVCLMPALAQHLWDCGHKANMSGYVQVPPSFSELCLTRAKKHAEELYAKELEQREIETTAIIECEAFAREGSDDYLQELAAEGLDCRGAVLGWFTRQLSDAMETVPVVSTSKADSYQFRERGSPPREALDVLKSLRASVEAIEESFALPKCLQVKVGGISRVNQAPGSDKSSLPSIWSGIPVELRIAGVNPVLAIWSTDDRLLKS